MTHPNKHALEVISIPEPCPEPWANMRGDDRVRFCGICSKNVFNLSAMKRAEAEALLEEHAYQLCVQLYRRADGTVVTADCTPERLAALRRGARRGLAFAGASVASLLAVVGGLGFGAAALWGQRVTEWTEPCITRTAGEPIPLGGAVAIDEPIPDVRDEEEPRADEEAPSPRDDGEEAPSHALD